MRKSLSFALALLGLFVSLYLLWSYTTPSRPMVCFGGGCDAVRASVYAHIHGIPMPVFGVAGYLFIVLLILAEPLVPTALAIEVRYALAGATSFGFLFSLYLEYLQAGVIHAFCAWCVTSGITMTALCALALYNVFRPAVEIDPVAHLAQLRAYFTVGVAALVIGAPAFYQLTQHGEKAPPPPPPASDTTADRLVRPDSHVFGNLDARVTVVEFGDFECPICGSEEEVTKAIRAKYASQIRFVFRQFPLTHVHPFSQRMAEASECAAEQGKFWEAADKIYSRQTDLTEDGLRRDASEIGLDVAKFNQCLASGAETARVERDRDDGKALGVVATPTFFINRRALPDVPDLDELAHAIDQELAAQANSATSATAAVTAPPAATAAAPEEKKPSAAAAASPKSTSTPGATTPARASSSPHAAGPASGGGGFGLLGAASGGALSSFQTGAGCSEAEAAMKQPTLIHTDQLREILAGHTQPLFVDVRPAKEYAARHIPGAINIPVGEMEQRWSSLPKDRVIVFYESGKSSGDICASGRAAGRTLLAHNFPFDQVMVYQDGLDGWEKSGLGTKE
jgi:protein-disulfide isomerase/rhodanese-related sulfurtransferase